MTHFDWYDAECKVANHRDYLKDALSSLASAYADATHLVPSSTMLEDIAGDIKNAVHVIKLVRDDLDSLRLQCQENDLKDSSEKDVRDAVSDLGVEEVLEIVAAGLNARAKAQPFTAQGIRDAESDLNCAVKITLAAEAHGAEVFKRN
jgi:hypothetical protein